ncbi:hypothetical protein C5B42_05070 [Candidatus Cerribacteria bacterium 'Amazon FNV 2010 28 9']|uniref:Uncharacterized protein n=1 Tax=Candidatus Cerribacteria bacterium 'Amazon FNV 2010 28 9' TaxID=2081795 RepID=A0A317JMD5_9BACT|nr:MAG: hypothetical protein C5B42_05070 [Candidatus Cerribacteria bacterium 'Amazon FNV 2010 28 9']
MATEGVPMTESMEEDKSYLHKLREEVEKAQRDYDVRGTQLHRQRLWKAQRDLARFEREWSQRFDHNGMLGFMQELHDMQAPQEKKAPQQPEKSTSQSGFFRKLFKRT